MEEWARKTVYILGEEKYDVLNRSHVAVVGVGGVGAFAAELLCRSGVGHLTLVDGDTVSESNRNRQLAALCSTLDQAKVDVMARRLKDINPNVDVRAFNQFLTETDAGDFPGRQKAFALDNLSPFDFVVDAIDMVPAKVALLAACLKNGIHVVSAMGAAGKYDPEQVRCCDISKTCQCGLAKAVRVRLASMGVRHGIPVVFSPEVPDLTHYPKMQCEVGKERMIPGTISYMPAVFGCHLAAYVIRSLTEKT